MIAGGIVENIIKDSHCGGRLLTYYDTEDEEYKGVTLNADNYFDYIYGAATTAEAANDAGCGYISSIDATPVYSTK